MVTMTPDTLLTSSPVDGLHVPAGSAQTLVSEAPHRPQTARLPEPREGRQAVVPTCSNAQSCRVHITMQCAGPSYTHLPHPAAVHTPTLPTPSPCSALVLHTPTLPTLSYAYTHPPRSAIMERFGGPFTHPPHPVVIHTPTLPSLTMQSTYIRSPRPDIMQYSGRPYTHPPRPDIMPARTVIVFDYSHLANTVIVSHWYPG